MKCPEKDANKTHLGKPGYVIDAISFCFVAKVPREMTAVSRTTKYTTARMQWNKREHPFCFGDVGASILNRRSGELLYREYSVWLTEPEMYRVYRSVTIANGGGI